MRPLFRAVRFLLYRPHLENGAAVTLGVSLAGAAVGAAWGLPAGIAAATGALCVSIADQPDALTEKPRAIAAAVVLSVAATALTLAAKGAIWAEFAVTAGVGLWAGLISAYGKRAIGLGVVTVLAFVLALAADTEGRAAILVHLGLFALGAAIYAAYALAAALALDRRVRRLLMAEALRSFAAYLRAKAALFDDRDAFAAMIEAHAAAVERMQIARDAIYARTAKPWQERQARALVALLDAFETILSSDADIEILRRSPHHHLRRRLKALTLRLAEDAERLSLVPALPPAVATHDAARQAIAGEIARIAPSAQGDEGEMQTLAAFRSTADKLAQSAIRIAAIGAAEPPAPHADLALFRQPAPRGFALLRANLGFGKPAFRYAARLALAMIAGLALTVAFPRFAHASWILLTIALIMRANFSVTRQRRWDRIAGTLIGCVLAAALQAFVPAGYLLVIVALATGVSHAFGAVNYRVTAASASVSALLLLHFLQPHAHHAMTERIADTLIGAALSYVFSFLWPNWEKNELPRTIAALLKADRDFACEAMTRARREEAYRLARKRLFDAAAALSGAVRRLADEPNAEKPLLARLNALLAANYLLLSDLTSMQVLYTLRGAELDALAGVEALTDEMRARVVETLMAAAPAMPPARLTRTARDELYRHEALSVLKRRLVHIEHAARRVAALAAAAP